jgi:hypothetical protein
MRLEYLFYGVLIGFLPLVVGLVAATIDPHGDAAQLPWLTMLTVPAGAIGGLGFALAS